MRSTIITSLILAITSFWNDSLIVDEIPHVGSGYSYIKKLDYRLNPEHPPLAKALAAMPLLFLDLKQNAFETRFWLENINGQWDFGRSLVFQSDNNADLITKTVKFSMLLLACRPPWKCQRVYTLSNSARTITALYVGVNVFLRWFSCG